MPVNETTFNPQPAAVSGRKRIVIIDVARGIALIAMAIYHFTWDLGFFGYVSPELAAYGGWKLFARCIASTFLFLVGVSLYLAHRNGIRWPGFWKRVAMVAGAAALITVATYVATPDSFVFFGILHQIALASLLGLAFLRLPAWIILPIAGGIIALPYLYVSDVFNTPALWWVGLSSERMHSNDYVPLFPWFGPVLIGIAIAKLAERANLFERLRSLSLARWTQPLDFFGRHGLAFYLIHQPVLIGLVWLVAQVAPPVQMSQEQRFLASCQRNCDETRGEDFCSYYCVCSLEQLSANKALDSIFGSSQTSEQNRQVQDVAAACTAETEQALQDGTPE